MSLYCIKSPDGHINPLTIAYGRNTCITVGRMYLIAAGEPDNWKVYYKQGYRCVPVEVLELAGGEDDNDTGEDSELSTNSE